MTKAKIKKRVGVICKAQKIGVTETMLSHERPTKPIFVPVECCRNHDIKMQVQRPDGTWECTVLLGCITTPGGIKAIECCDLKPGQQLPNGASMMPDVKL